MRSPSATTAVENSPTRARLLAKSEGLKGRGKRMRDSRAILRLSKNNCIFLAEARRRPPGTAMLRKLAQIIAPVALALGMTMARPAHAEGDVKVLVLKENGIGTASAAQAYVDKLIAAVAQQNGWTSAAGKYTTSRSAAEEWIKANKPS